MRGFLLTFPILLAACASGPPPTTSEESIQSRTQGARPLPAPEGGLVVFARGFGDGFFDDGWSPRELPVGAPARIDVSAEGGWAIRNNSLDGKASGLVFRFQAPSELGDLLSVRLGVSAERLKAPEERAPSFPMVRIGPLHRFPQAGWEEAWVLMSELNPENKAFDLIIFQGVIGRTASVESARAGGAWVLIDDVRLLDFKGRSTPAPVVVEEDEAAVERDAAAAEGDDGGGAG